LKKVLDAWGAFLCSPESATCLGTDIEGWFGEAAVPILESVSNQAGVVNGLSEHKFHELFQCDPSAPHHDFKSWDDFFTRLYRPEIRPVVSPEDDNVVANACESQVYKVAHNVHARDRFWVKNQPYSVMDMLAFDSFAEQFVGGTIYQAFLSALSYHRWHSPVSGRIVKAYVVDGTYYSEPLFEAFNEEDQLQVPGGINIGGENASQEYLSAVATRGIIFIEADHPKIGLMAFIAIGMVEVSTCDITVREGQHVKKGDQLG